MKVTIYVLVYHRIFLMSCNNFSGGICKLKTANGKCIFASALSFTVKQNFNVNSFRNQLKLLEMAS